jgi:polyisoprenoid-binding protein YceI
MSTQTLTIAPVGAWQLDPVHSRVGFEVPYLAGTFKGEFREVEARLTVDGDRASLEGAAMVSSVDVKDENLSAHLQSPDFFDAERHPELRFSASDVRLDGETVTVDGEITMKGVTQPIQIIGSVSAPMVDAYGKDRLGLQVEAKVDRTEFGIDWNMPLPTGQPALANEVRIVGDLQFVKSA